MAPSLTLDSYRQIGRNAAGYALGHLVAPAPTVLDNYAREADRPHDAAARA